MTKIFRKFTTTGKTAKNNHNNPGFISGISLFFMKYSNIYKIVLLFVRKCDKIQWIVKKLYNGV